MQVKSLRIRLYFQFATAYTDVNSLNTLQLCSLIPHLYITHISKLIEVTIIIFFSPSETLEKALINSPSPISLNFRVLTLSFITTCIKIRIFSTTNFMTQQNVPQPEAATTQQFTNLTS